MAFKNSSVSRWKFSPRPPQVLLIIFMLFFWSIVPSLSFAQSVLLEDFSAPVPKNGNGDDVWSTYNGFNPSQTYDFANGQLNLHCGNGGECYMHFFPYPYNVPSGFAKYYIKSGTWDQTLNRLTFQVKCTANVPRRSDGGAIMEFGTYIRNYTGGDPADQGAHYYHQFDPNFYPNRVMVWVINQHPQHQVGISGDPGVNPVNNYFDGLTRFYWMAPNDGTNSAWNGATCSFDSFIFSKISGEPDAEVSSITGQYTGSRYEGTWATPPSVNYTYSIRYSTSSMKVKVSGFASGTDGGTVQSTGDDYVGAFWPSPVMGESSTGMYVAIQPPAQSAFTEVYIPNGSNPPLPPAAPTKLRIR